MSAFLSFSSPLEFLLRYTVIAGVVISVIGLALVFMCKRLTMAIRKQDILDKSDKLYTTLFTVGIIIFLIGLIVMVLPINDTLYKG